MIKRFLSYVEIMTKITGVFPFMMTLAYLFCIGQPINWQLTGVYFVAMFLFDLATTAINNYVDTKTNHQTLQFDRKIALAIIIVLLTVSTALGLWLAYLTDLVVLLLGAVCFACGIFYTYGPLPISRQPLGEVFSGIFCGLFIPFILFYINMPADTYLTLQLSMQTIGVQIQLMPVAVVLLLSAAPVLATANIMLANNICDLERDIAVRRHTLPYYLGNKALGVFAGCYYLIYLAAVLLVVFQVLPWIYLLIFLTLIPVQKNINQFYQKQEKASTFICSIRNYIVIMSAHVLLIAVSHWFI